MKKILPNLMLLSAVLAFNFAYSYGVTGHRVVAEIAENLKMRDHIDTTRDESPLRQAEDAVYIDNSLMTLDEQVEMVVRLADEQIGLVLRSRENK